MVKQVTVVCPHEGADKGKRFVITRMSAVAADRWGRHCLQAAASSGADIAGVAAGGGIAAVAAAGIGIFAAMDPARMDELIDQLLQCVQMQPDPSNPAMLLPWDVVSAGEQIEEIPTLGWLQKEAFALHVDFFKGVGQLFSLLTLMLGTESNAPAPASAT
ncbi:hypothetical protein [Acetobacter ghanensis]|uniref:Uncharacterized protein n=1 Tax=Acetobacter ghanensis TaxID=431306 RepID=A0A0U5BH07_9PROT|nr:hypothetical protein [Acetobacter ghanensis]NHO39475.1 hypothetical protein [Acetobacter ghanensis]GBQ46385.1 hypothetical protein AA18895_0748 [Acetobacter ghanensis DSM 18895]CEF54630.1 hypothetical protein AGA_888 [Acetobacter ghanensis]